jgi:hypothetical protein
MSPKSLTEIVSPGPVVPPEGVVALAEGLDALDWSAVVPFEPPSLELPQAASNANAPIKIVFFMSRFLFRS